MEILGILLCIVLCLAVCYYLVNVVQPAMYKFIHNVVNYNETSHRWGCTGGIIGMLIAVVIAITKEDIGPVLVGIPLSVLGLMLCGWIGYSISRK